MTGALLKGRYRLHERIGSGGMSNVYRAQDLEKGTQVAVKVLKEEHGQNEALVKAFEAEARTGRLLDHPNIVRMLDAGEEGGRRFIVMELARGITLKEVLNEQITLDYEVCISIAIQVLMALAHAHAKRIVHRDIKPHNILMQSNGRVKVYDFGIAQTIGCGSEGEDAKRANVQGTVHYISPEQARAENAEVRSDIYSLGIMLYEMLTGTLPFTGDSAPEVAKKHINEAVPAPRRVDSNIPRALNDIVLRATRKNPRLRYRNAQEMIRDLQRAQDEPDGDFVQVREERLASAPRNEEPISPDRVRRRLRAIILAVIALVAATVCIVVFGGAIARPRGAKVASVTGLTQAAATEKLKAAGFKVEVVNDVYVEVEEGVVFNQQPAAGETLAPGGTVTIYVSVGAVTVAMPDLTELRYAKAVEAIRKHALTLGEVTQMPGELPKGYVMRQDPLPGEEIASGTPVDLWVSAGPGTMEAP